jgi:hypothetical protein
MLNKILATLLVIGLALLNILFFYLQYAGQYPSFEPDSLSYLSVANTILQGHLPLFTIRPPGYPLFLAFILGIFKHDIAIYLAQSVLVIIAGLGLFTAINKLTDYKYKIINFLFIFFIILGPFLTFYQTQILSETFYTVTLIGAFTYWFLALHEYKTGYFIIASLLSAWVIYIRPSGIFMVGVIFILILYLIYNKYPKKYWLAAILPFFLALLLLCTYNWLTIDNFNFTNFGPYSSLPETSLYWQKNSQYPPKVNKIIDEMANSVSSEERFDINNSWSPKTLASIFSKHYDYSLYNLWLPKVGYDPILMKRVAKDAIQSNPKLYIKFVLANLYVFLVPQHSHPKLNERSFINPDTIFLPNSLQCQLHIVKYFNNICPAAKPAAPSTSTIQISTIFYTVQQVLQNILAFPLNLLSKWYLTLLLPLYAFYLLVKIKGRDLYCFLAFLCSVSIVGAGLVIALSELVNERYTGPTEFLVSLSILFVVLHHLQHNKKIKQTE